MMQATKRRSVLARAFATRGRAGRLEFMAWAAAAAAIGLVAVLVDVEISPRIGAPDGLIFVLGFALAATIAMCAAGRRLHDVGRSAWWLAAGVAPVAGWALLAWWLLSPSVPALNRHGRPPRGVFWT